MGFLSVKRVGGGKSNIGAGTFIFKEFSTLKKN